MEEMKMFSIILIMIVWGFFMCLAAKGNTQNESTKLPCNYKSKHRGIWFLHIQHQMGKPSQYVRADVITGIDYDYEGNLQITFSNGETKSYSDVFGFDFVQSANVGDYCWSENPYHELYEPQK